VTVLVTGAAGFVGSTLCDALLMSGPVRGVDIFTPYYSRALKERNLESLRTDPNFSLVEADLAESPLEEVLEGVDVVFHLAGQPGVRPSWGREFQNYVRQNVFATQRLLEACLAVGTVKKLVYASSSSVYGDAESYPTAETLAPRPVSPYGVTKLAGEHLCELYRTNFGLQTASLRLFTVYGPRQRPDMGFSRLLNAALDGDTFTLYGDGRQTRDFTYVEDVVRAMIACARSPWCGVANVGGGSRIDMRSVISIVQALTGPISIVHESPAKGDVRDTAADIGVAQAAFGYAPSMKLADGMRVMFEALRHQRAVSA
jgi:nucleoside-diphosphate-sugar epimerase